MKTLSTILLLILLDWTASGVDLADVQSTFDLSHDLLAITNGHVFSPTSDDLVVVFGNEHDIVSVDVFFENTEGRVLRARIREFASMRMTGDDRTKDQIENPGIDLGDRHANVYLADLNGNGLEEIYGFSLYGTGLSFAGFEMQNGELAEVIGSDLNLAYAFPVQVTSTDRIRIYPAAGDTNVSIGDDQYLVRYEDYRWDCGLRRFTMVGGGTTIGHWDRPGTGLIVPSNGRSE